MWPDAPVAAPTTVRRERSAACPRPDATTLAPAVAWMFTARVGDADTTDGRQAMPRPVHFEIHATDPQAAVTFYEQVFGWKIEQWGDQPYWLITTGDTS